MPQRKVQHDNFGAGPHIINIIKGDKWAKLPKSPENIPWNGNINFLLNCDLWKWIFKSQWSQKSLTTNLYTRKYQLFKWSFQPMQTVSHFVSQTPLNHSLRELQRDFATQFNQYCPIWMNSWILSESKQWLSSVQMEIRPLKERYYRSVELRM